MPHPAVLVEDLVVRYGDRNVVDGLSFSAPQGQVLALVGPNGAGKTTTVESCVGLRSPESGRVEVLGASAGRIPRQRVGVMLQDGGLYPTARPLELVAHVAGLYPNADDPAGLLAALGIDPSTRTAIRRLSGGEQQRVKCALALVGRPDLVFLDEPTAGLDSGGRRTFHDLIRGLTAQGTTVVLTTHLMDDVERLADRIVVVARGRDVHHGSVSDLVGDSDTIWFRLPPAASLDSLRAVLPSAIPVEDSGQGFQRIDAGADPSVLGVVATWCGQHHVPTSDVIVGRRSLEDVVQSLIEDRRMSARSLHQAGWEVRLLLRNGEQLLLTFVIPVALLLGLGLTSLMPDAYGSDRVAQALATVLAVSVISAAFTSLAIATGFERRSGALRFLEPLP